MKLDLGIADLALVFIQELIFPLHAPLQQGVTLLLRQ